MKKRILSFALALCFVFTLIPTAFADSAPTSGECGENLTWTLEDGTLTISGKGEMWGYELISDNGSYKTSAPWGECYSSIKSVVINDGITSIGRSAFYGCSSLTSVTIPDSVTSIGSSAFRGCSNLASVTNTGAKKGTKYYYKVKAICSANTNANSAFSAVVSIKATK